MSSSILRAIVARGGFNPLTDIPSVAYWDMHTPDAAYETLPGSTLATDQNDGIGALLDIKRYKERVEKHSDPTFQSAGSDWSRTGTGWTFSVGSAYMNGPVDGAGDMYDSDFMPTAGTLYEAEATFGDSNGGTCYFRAIAGAGSYTSFKAGPGETVKMLLVADGTVPVALRGSASWIGSITEFHVREVPGYQAIQAVAANQPVLNIENGIRSALFDGVDDRLSIPNSKDAFNFLHDGTGGELTIAVRMSDLSVSRYVCGSLGTGASSTGVTVGVSPSGALICKVGNGSGAFIADFTSDPVLAIGEKAVISYGYESGRVYLRKNGAVVADAAVAGSPSAGDATYDMAIGAARTGAPASLMAGDIYAACAVQGALTDYQRQRLTSYMLRRAGV